MAEDFVRSYDDWAQSGFGDPIPYALRDLATDEMVEVLESDQRWHLTGGIKQHGGIKIVSTDVTEASDASASVTVTIDASAVTVTAEGQDTWVDYSEPIVTTFELVRDHQGWLINSSST